MIGFYKFSNLIGFLEKSNVTLLYGNGWHGQRIRAEEIPYSNNSIRVTVQIAVTDPPVDNRAISNAVEELISDRLDDFERRYPGILAEISPKIDIVIKKQ